MSYEECLRHNEEATNGCASCYREHCEAAELRLTTALDGVVKTPLLDAGGDSCSAHLILRYLSESGFRVIDNELEYDLTDLAKKQRAINGR